MASRRVRIKGIANIPQRKKVNTAENEPANETVSEDAKKPPEKESDRCHDKPNLTFEAEPHVEVQDTKTHVVQHLNIEQESVIDAQIANNADEIEKLKENTDRQIPTENDAISNSNRNETTIAVKPLPPVRRKFIKPQIAVNSVNRKKEKPDNIVVEPNKENVQEVVNVNLNETVIAPNVSPVKNDVTPGPLSVKISPTFIPQKDITKCGSDTEYPPPPISPSKLLNRRIKAVPRLHQRRTSFSIGSASESEDDSRRSTHSRVRNDSVCSVASIATDTHAPAKEATSPTRKEVASNQPRKFRRSEQGRKIAEARRNFYQKFADGKPDKQKLTMIDLIYYNPVTNPMNPRKRRETTSTICDDAPSPKPTNVVDDETVDDPNRNNSEEDDENVLAPQIKVGPNGEIVIDEKSLVIENVETKKSRQALEMAEVIDGDFDTSYGVFKRVKRAKDWSNEETLRFYKALNTIGTDFTMMCELFPKRNRRELKLKFKREEKINKALIDRAVMQPVEFDMKQLRKELEEHERFVEEKKKCVEEVKLAKEKEKQKRLERKQDKKRSLIGIAGAELDDSEGPVIKKDQKPKRKRRKKHPYDNLKKGIASLLEDTDDSDEEYKPASTEKNAEAKRVTIPREVKKIATDLEEDNEKSLEPGSLMIIPSSQSGKTLYKVYMITEGQSKEELRMDEETIKKITSTTSQQNAEKIVNVQNIITISENCMEDRQIPNNENLEIEVTENSIIFPFDECPVTTNNNSNITISHEDNKMTIVTEN